MKFSPDKTRELRYINKVVHYRFPGLGPVLQTAEENPFVAGILREAEQMMRNEEILEGQPSLQRAFLRFRQLQGLHNYGPAAAWGHALKALRENGLLTPHLMNKNQIELSDF